MLFFIITAVRAWNQFSIILRCSFAGRWVPRTLSAWNPAVPQQGYWSTKRRLSTSDTKMSRGRGSVTKNNGFRIGWLDLLTPSCAITLNYNQLQQLIINLLPRTRSILILLSQFSCNFWTAELPNCLLFLSSFYCDWLRSDLRATHFWFTNELRIMNDGSLTNECVLTCPPFITSGRTEYKSPPPTVPLSSCAYSLLRERVAIRCPATDVLPL
jgi:hypothetical protein